MTKHLRITLLPFFFAGIFENALSQTISELSFYTPLISTFDMDYGNDHLYVTQQYLRVFDVSDPTDPEQVGTVLYPGSYAYQIAAENDHVYMAMGGNGIFAMYNVANPTMPWLTGSISIPSTTFLLAGDVIPFGDYVYMGGFDTLYVIDVSDSSALQVIQTNEISDVGFGGAGPMGIVDRALFITTSIALQIFDITDPANPVFLTSFSNIHSGQNGIGIDTIGKRIFLPWVNALATHTGYDAIDVSDPAVPVFLFSDSTSFGGGDYGEAAYYSNVLFISDGGGVNAFDVSPFNHHYVTSFTGPNVGNASVALDIRDSVFYNARGSGFEVLLYSGGFPTVTNEVSTASSSLQFFPNPVAAATSELNFHLNESITYARVVIRNSWGREVAGVANTSFKNGVGKISLPPFLPPGLYFAIVSWGDRSFTGKVLIE